MEIIKVYNKELFKAFLDVQDIINQNVPNYISPLKQNTTRVLNRKKNPLWKESDYALFVAFIGGKAVGRIAAIYSRKHNYIYNDNCGYFGYFDVINDSNIAKELLKAARGYLTQFNCIKMIGPLNPTANYELGVLIDGFKNKPFFMMNYNQPYYANVLSDLGGYKEMTFKAYEMFSEDVNTEKIQRVSVALHKRYDITIEDIDFSRLNEEARSLCAIYNSAFESHWGAIPFSEDEFIYIVNDMKMIMDKNLIFKLRKGRETVGFIMALPNLNEAIEKLKNGKLSLIGVFKFLYFKRKIKWAKVMVSAIHKKYQHLGLGSILYCEIARRIINAGYKGGELSWVAENNNAMNKIILSMEAKVSKEYQIYRFDIEESSQNNRFINY